MTAAADADAPGLVFITLIEDSRPHVRDLLYPTPTGAEPPSE
ncbi:MAG: hypothetical protein ACRDSL_24740 [Pseudonocardiaceae bacterium]